MNKLVPVNDSKENNYKELVKKLDIDPNSTYEWYRLIEKAIEEFNFEAILFINESNCNSIILKELAQRELERIMFFVEEAKTTLSYIFEGNIYVLSENDKLVFGEGGIVGRNTEKKMITEWSTCFISKQTEDCFNGMQSFCNMEADKFENFLNKTRDLYEEIENEARISGFAGAVDIYSNEKYREQKFRVVPGHCFDEKN